MLPSDMALVWDPTYLGYVREFGSNRRGFRQEAMQAFKKLVELGCEGLQPELGAHAPELPVGREDGYMFP